jgi:LPXTG-motif cell wall-anchored protein
MTANVTVAAASADQPAPAPADASGPATAAATGDTSAATLPNTGLDARVVALVGVVLLLLGLPLRSSTKRR